MFKRWAAALSGALLGALALGASAPARAGLPVLCERGKDIGAADQDRVLRFAGAVKAELERSESDVAIVARAGLDLSRFGLLYSHAGIALRDNPAGPWAVRQLYYACDQSRPRLFDQGMAGFALGADTPGHNHISLLLPPPDAAAPLARTALDKRLGLALLAGQYSANAYAFGTRYQNCNQWVAELLAGAWGHPAAADNDADAPRARAQAWLRAQGYAAGPVRIPSHWLMFAGQFVPLVHLNDHPVDDVYALALRVSVPDAIEDFVHAQAPATRRVELCQDARHIVVHRGWGQAGRRLRAAAWGRGHRVRALAGRAGVDRQRLRNAERRFGHEETPDERMAAMHQGVELPGREQEAPGRVVAAVQHARFAQPQHRPYRDDRTEQVGHQHVRRFERRKARRDAQHAGQRIQACMECQEGLRRGEADGDQQVVPGAGAYEPKTRSRGDHGRAPL
jgi:hypothetical protein